MTVAYAKQRVQYGHVDRRVPSRQTPPRRRAHRPGVRSSPGLRRRAQLAEPRDISAAKAAASDAAYQAARAALQLHGAIGYTDEYDLSVYFKKIRALHSAWGNPSFHRDRLLSRVRIGATRIGANPGSMTSRIRRSPQVG